MAISLQRIWLKLNFGTKERIRVYEKLHTFLTSNVALRKALEIMYQHASDDGRKKNNPVALILLEWLRDIKNGRDFGHAIQGWVPDSERLVIEGGEQASLPDAIQRAIMISESLRSITATIRNGLAYPCMLFAAAIGFMFFFGISVIPQFEEILPRDQWYGIAYQMALMSDFARNWLIWVLLLLAALGVLIGVTMPRWTGPMRVRFDRYPPWSLYRLVIGSGFMLTAAAMLKAGVKETKVLISLQRGASKWYTERLSRTHFQIKGGNNFGEALYRTGFNFPDKETVKDLRAYARLGKFEENLERMGERWLTESVKRVKAQVSVLFMVCLLFFGGVFFWIAGGIFSLVNQVQTATGG